MPCYDTPAYNHEYMLKLVYHPDELLREQSAPVDTINGDIAAFARDMVDSMHAERGIGLAAVQVGHLLRMFVTDVTGDEARVFINPEITAFSDRQNSIEEGCLSIPGMYSDVKRSEACEVSAWDELGRHFSLEADGMLARVIMHELDHLNGVLFFDHLRAGRRRRLLDRYEKSRQKDA